MGNAVIDSLEENLDSIEIVAKPTRKAFAKDRNSTGNAKEVSVQEFITSYLTLDCRIKKGHIYSLNDTSDNIDCVVLLPSHPKLITPKREIILAEGVHAAIEIKPDISTLTKGSEFHRGLKQIQSVKNINRGRNPYNGFLEDWFHRIPGIIFSFKSQELSKIVKYLQKIYRAGLISEFELPDVIISLDKGILFYCPHIKNSMFGHYVETCDFIVPDKMFIELPIVGSTQLVWFLKILFSFPSPSASIANSILKKYLNIGDGYLASKVYSLDSNEGFYKKEGLDNI